MAPNLDNGGEIVLGMASGCHKHVISSGTDSRLGSIALYLNIFANPIEEEEEE